MEHKSVIPLIPTGIFLTDNSRLKFPAQYPMFQYGMRVDLAVYYYSDFMMGEITICFQGACISRIFLEQLYLQKEKQIGVNSRNERLDPIYWIRCDSHADFDLGSLLRTGESARYSTVLQI
jgi:hypothetical protein